MDCAVEEIRTRTYRHRDLIGRIPTLVRRKDGSLWRFNRFEEVLCHGNSTRTEAGIVPYSSVERTQAVSVRYAPIYIKV